MNDERMTPLADSSVSTSFKPTACQDACATIGAHLGQEATSTRTWHAPPTAADRSGRACMRGQQQDGSTAPRACRPRLLRTWRNVKDVACMAAILQPPITGIMALILRQHRGA
eukprot:357392-Chlamydomonas_euryale.AAC.36